MKECRSCSLLLFAALLATPCFSQFNKNFKDITNKDVIEALQFAGVDIFKFKVNSHNKSYKFYVFADEFTHADSLKRVDTLLTLDTQFKTYSDKKRLVTKYIDFFRFLTRVLNNSYETIYLFVSTNYVDTWKELHISPQFSRKHYWVRFSEQKTQVNKVIPLLFYGSEWDDIIDGRKVTRFCSMDELRPELADPTIKFVPHYFIISYKFQEKE